MLALVSHERGDPQSLKMETDWPCPAPGPNEILLRIGACALNYPDALMIADRYQVRLPRPFVPGCEMAGVVKAIGPGVSGFAPGDRLFGTGSFGGLAEYGLINAARSFLVPHDMSLPAASGLLVTYGTAYHALKDHAVLKPEETLLVLGAAGGVGLAAVQLGKAMGARVVAAVSSPAKAAVATAAGADETLVYSREIDGDDEARALAGQFKAVVGKPGADVVFDPLGGRYAEPSVRALAWEGRYLVIGFAAGLANINTNLLLLKGARASGVYWGHWTERNPVEFHAEVNELLALWQRAQIVPAVSQLLPLTGAVDGLNALAGRTATGKIVIEIDAALR